MQHVQRFCVCRVLFDVTHSCVQLMSGRRRCAKSLLLVRLQRQSPPIRPCYLSHRRSWPPTAQTIGNGMRQSRRSPMPWPQCTAWLTHPQTSRCAALCRWHHRLHWGGTGLAMCSVACTMLSDHICTETVRDPANLEALFCCKASPKRAHPRHGPTKPHQHVASAKHAALYSGVYFLASSVSASGGPQRLVCVCCLFQHDARPRFMSPIR